MRQFLLYVDHPAFMALYGTFAYFVLMWSIAKNRKENGFNSSLWWSRNYDDILVTIVIGFGIVVFDDEMISIYNNFADNDKPLEFQRWMYLLPGPATNIVYKLASKLIK